MGMSRNPFTLTNDTLRQGSLSASGLVTIPPRVSHVGFITPMGDMR